MTQNSQFNNALEVFKLLPQTNCQECRMRTCMAFAGAVYTGSRKLRDCPYLPESVIEQYSDSPVQQPEIQKNIDNALKELKKRIADVDLADVATHLGGQYDNGLLTLKVLGKNYSINQKGEIFTDIHIIPWITLPVYNYIIRGGKNAKLTGNWVPLRELPSGKDWYRLFGQRCEKPLKRLADNYPDLFHDMVKLFSGKHSDPYFQSDISVILHPLPKLPMMICYWLPEDDLASQLSLFFDSSAEEYLDLNSINSLGSGFVTMLEKLTLRHTQ